MMTLLKALTLKRLFYACVLCVFLGLVWIAHERGEKYQAEVLARNKERAEQMFAVATAERVAREKELAAQAAFEKERKLWDEERLKMQAAIADLHGNTERLQRTIAAGEAGDLSTSEKPGTAAGTEPSAQAAWVVLSQCVNEYAALAADADELNSRLNIAQRWAKSLPE